MQCPGHMDAAGSVGKDPVVLEGLGWLWVVGDCCGSSGWVRPMAEHNGTECLRAAAAGVEVWCQCLWGHNWVWAAMG